MSEQPITRPNAVTYSLEDIVAEVFQGRVRIPDFQRGFRWQWEDVRRLLDSIVRGYPIGSLLLWQRPAEEDTLRLGALKISAPKLQQALWVVDGQQRLTSLANALSDDARGDPRFAAAYDLGAGAFIKEARARANAIPLSVVFDLQRLLRWFSEHPESAEYFDVATRVAKAIRQYAIPAYIVKQQDEAVLRDIFDRMNNYGKRLTRAEVFSALHSAEGGAGPPRTLEDIVEQIDAGRGFGLVDQDTVLRGVLARRGPDVTREIRAEFDGERMSREFPSEGVDAAYAGGEAAIDAAVNFLQQEAGVPHFGFLTYRYLLVVLARFFAHHPEPAPRNVELLRRWFWRASMAGPEKFGGWTQAMRTLASQVGPDDESRSVQSLLNSLEGAALEVPNVGRFRTTAADSRMLLCAMWAAGPRSVSSGRVYDQPMVSQVLQGRTTAADLVFKIQKREPEGARALAANRIILLGDDVDEQARAYFQCRPPGIDESVWHSTLDSHCITPHLASCLASGANVEFLRGREELLGKVLRAFLMRMAELELEDTPPLDGLDFDDGEPDPSANDGQRFDEGS